MRLSIQNFLLLLTFCCISCSIKAPEVRVVGQRSLLEQQILGSYESSVQDQWMLSMLRADSLSRTSPTPWQSEGSLLLTLKRRRFNADDLQQSLALGYVGEAWDGRLHPMLDSTFAGDMAAVERLVRQENADRRMLLERLHLLHPEDSLEVCRVFTRIQQKAAPSGSQVQSEEGEWKTRP